MGVLAMVTGVTFGAFDLLHAGHVMLLREAKDQCSHLTVGLHIDPSKERPDEKAKPIQSLFERFIQLDSLDCVDSIVPYETEKDLDYMLRFYKFNKRFLGSDYRNAYGRGEIGSQKTCNEIGTQITFILRFHEFSSTELRNRIKNG